MSWLDEQDADRDAPVWHDMQEFLATHSEIDERTINQACTRLKERGQIRADWDGGSLVPSVVRVELG